MTPKPFETRLERLQRLEVQAYRALVEYIEDPQFYKLPLWIRNILIYRGILQRDGSIEPVTLKTLKDAARQRDDCLVRPYTEP